MNYKDKSLINTEDYRFTAIKERNTIAIKASNDLEKHASEFLKGDMSNFIKIRKLLAQQRNVSKTIVEHTKTGEKVESINEEDLKFKEKYS